MKLRNLLVVGLIVVLLSMAVAAQAAPAAPATDITLTPVADDLSYLSGGTILNNETLLIVRASTSPAFVSQYQSYLEFDLTNQVPAGKEITSATLVLRSTAISGLSLTMNLYGSTVIGWTEGNGHLTWAEKPAISTGVLATSDLAAVDSNVTFSSSAAFVDFLNQQLGTSDQNATLAIVATAGNGGTGLFAYQYMASKDNTSGYIAPQLILTSALPTAVTMSTFQAADPAANWPLIAGLGALAAVVIGGLAVTRRRSAGR